MKDQPKPSLPPRKRHGDVLLDTLRKSGLSGEADDTSSKREYQQQEGTDAPRQESGE
jgi:hypothetical protein